MDVEGITVGKFRNDLNVCYGKRFWNIYVMEYFVRYNSWCYSEKGGLGFIAFWVNFVLGGVVRVLVFFEFLSDFNV